MNGAQALLMAFTDAGLDTCFGNPGTSEMQFLYEVSQTDAVRAVLCLQENTATGAADGYARMAGKPAFTLLHVGSGFANSIANIHNAGRANVPMVNVVGANATYHQVNFPEHELINGRITDLARVVSHWTQEARTASELGSLGAQAARYSRMGAGKICTLVAPTDCHWDPAVAPPKCAEPIATPRIPEETIQEVAALLSNGRKTAILAGASAMHGDGAELAGRIAARTGADLLGESWASRFARGEGNVLFRQVPYVAEMALPFFASYQQLILVGTSRPVVTFAYQGIPVTKVPEGCTTTTLATIDHDILAALRDLAHAVDALSASPARQPRTQAPVPTGTLTPDAVGRSLCVLLPEDAILVDEAITMGLTTFEHTKGARRHDYLHAGCGGAIGGGLPLALGAAIACPQRKVVALQADGSAMYTNQALWSIARENADVTIVLLRNDSYAVLHFELARVREGEENDKMRSLLDLDGPTIDWVQMAQSQGVPASRATTAEEFHQQLQAALASRGPRLIEAKVAQDIQPFINLVRRGR